MSSSTLAPNASILSGSSVPMSLEEQSLQGGTWQVGVPTGAHSKIGNKREAGTRLKIPPWRLALNPLCLSGSIMAWELEPENKRCKCCRPRQASTTAHISGTTVLPSNFWLQTAPRDAWGKACTGTSALPRGWLGFSYRLDLIRKGAKVCWKNKHKVTEKVLLWVNCIKNIVFWRKQIMHHTGSGLPEAPQRSSNT